MDVKETIASVISSFNIDELIKTLSHDPPMWVFVVAALIPLSITIVFREICCWFWKINRIIRRVRNIELTLADIEDRLSELQPQQKPLLDQDDQ